MQPHVEGAVKLRCSCFRWTCMRYWGSRCRRGSRKTGCERKPWQNWSSPNRTIRPNPRKASSRSADTDHSARQSYWQTDITCSPPRSGSIPLQPASTIPHAGALGKGSYVPFSKKFVSSSPADHDLRSYGSY